MKTIVILDNQPGSIQGMEATLQRHGFAIFRVSTSGEAAALSKRPQVTIDLLIACVDLPGNTAAVELQESCPDIPMLLLSELPLDRWPEKEFRYFESSGSRTDFLRKPLTAGTFVSKVKALLYNVTYTAGRDSFKAASALRLPQVHDQN